MMRRRLRACPGTLPAILPTLCAVVMLAACSPALNWREVEGVAEQRGWFPCKPERIERQVSLQGRLVPARLVACDAQGATWSTMGLQFAGPVPAAEALATVRDMLMMNLQAEEAAPPPGLAAGVDGLQWLAGRRADGAPLTVAVRLRVQGRWLVQQVLMTGKTGDWPRSLDAAALNTFFEGAFTPS